MHPTNLYLLKNHILQSEPHFRTGQFYETRFNYLVNSLNQNFACTICNTTSFKEIVSR